ncbi:unnamed protein product [Somion occarium]|uniref:PH domain-containing protein n=1 Tax=Somion occarium TaxID=3059160 RepID=A0ABP1EAI2_9APHY
MMSRSVPPPSQQEIQRKLSVHSVVKPIVKKKPTVSTAPVSGTESDSDSVFSPDIVSASPLPTSISGTPILASSSQPPLSSIAEARSGSGEESEEDEEEEEGGWHVQTNDAIERSALEETVLKTGYLWKKGERRKTWKKRWFVLRPAHLAFYKTSAEYKLLRLLDLSDIHSCTPVALKKHANTFGLVSPTRTFYLQAETAQGMQEWVKAITNAKNTLLATSTQSSASAPIPIPTPTNQRSYQAGPMSASPSSHSPMNYHFTSSDSEDASPSGPRSYSTVETPVIPHTDMASPSKQPGAAKEAPKVILSGYLMKCGSRRHTWHNRWFVLSADKLLYCRSHMDTKPHRQIPLSQILDALEYDLPAHRHGPSSIVSSPPASSPHPQSTTFPINGPEGAQTHTFKIITPKKTLLLCAPSEEEEIKWLSAVRALIARRSGAGGIPGENGATSVPASSSKSAPPAQGMGGNEAGVSGTSGITVTGKRRDSIARRLSLSGGGGFASSGSPAPSPSLPHQEMA